MAGRQNDTAFVDGLCILIEREDVSIAEVAEWSGIGGQTVREICRTRRRPWSSSRDALAAVFRMTAEEVEEVGRKAKAAEAEP